MSDLTYTARAQRTPLPRLAMSTGLTLFFLPLVLMLPVQVLFGSKRSSAADVLQTFVQRSSYLVTAIALVLIVLWLVGRGQRRSSLGKTFFAGMLGACTVSSVWVMETSRKANAMDTLPDWTFWLLGLINCVVLLRWWYEARGRALEP